MNIHMFTRSYSMNIATNTMTLLMLTMLLKELTHTSMSIPPRNMNTITCPISITGMDIRSKVVDICHSAGELLSGEYMKKLFVFCSFSLMLLLSSCSLRQLIYPIQAVEPEEIFLKLPVEFINGYELAQLRDSSQKYVIFSPAKRASDGTYYSDFTYSVSLIGWADDFIVIEQHGAKKSWVLIDIKTEQVYECIDFPEVKNMCGTYEGFLAYQEKLGVPKNIEMQEIEQVYEEMSENQK